MYKFYEQGEGKLQNEDPEGIKKEKDTYYALKQIFPQTLNDIVEPKYFGNIEKEDTLKVVPNTSALGCTTSKNNLSVSDGYKKESEFRTEQNSVKRIDPWLQEKIFDKLQDGVIYSFDGGIYKKVKLPRPKYRDVESFKEISRDKFNSIIHITLKLEGGYSNNKYDRGGKTKYGITQIFIDEYKNRVENERVPDSVVDITLEDAKKLYKAQWDKFNLGYIRNKKVATVINDYMINSNAYSVVVRLKHLLNNMGYDLNDKPILDVATINAINDCNPDVLADSILKERANYYRSIVKKDPLQVNNLKGWFNRLDTLKNIIGSNVDFRNIISSDEK